MEEKEKTLSLGSWKKIAKITLGIIGGFFIIFGLLLYLEGLLTEGPIELALSFFSFLIGMPLIQVSRGKFRLSLFQPISVSAVILFIVRFALLVVLFVAPIIFLNWGRVPKEEFCEQACQYGVYLIREKEAWYYKTKRGAIVLNAFSTKEECIKDCESRTRLFLGL